MPAIYAALAQDSQRNDLIFDDVLKSLEAKRSPVVLTERKDHLEYLRNRFSPFVKNHLLYLTVKKLFINLIRFMRKPIFSKPM